MYWKLIGYIKLKISGDNALLFFNECKQENIEMKNIIKDGSDFYVDILCMSLRLVNDIAEKFNISVVVVGKFGLIMKIFVYRTRMCFILSAVVLGIIFCLNTLFINEIKITGNNYLTNEQIESVLRENGIFPGRFIPTIKPDIIKDKILLSCTRLSWIWIDIKGNSANVDVREKTSLPEFYDTTYSCNIVASRDGVVTKAVSEMGVPCVSEGMYVKEGDLLIGGVYDSTDYAPVRFVRAAGTVYAKTKYSLSNTYFTNYHSYSIKEKNVSSYEVEIFGFKFEINSKIPEKSFLVKSNEKKIEIFGKKYLPLAFTNKQYCEIIREECYTDINQTSQRAIKDLTTRLYASIPSGAEVINVIKDVNDNNDGSVNVSVTFECVEDIALEKSIEILPFSNHLSAD